MLTCLIGDWTKAKLSYALDVIQPYASCSKCNINDTDTIQQAHTVSVLVKRQTRALS